MQYFLATIRVMLPPVFIFVFTANLKSQHLKTSDTIISEEIRERIAPYFSPPDEYKDQYGTFRSPLQFYDGHLVKTPNDWKKRREEILARWNKLMGEWPPLLKNQKMKILDSVRRDGFSQYRVQFFWTPNEETEGYLLIPDGKGKKPAVVTVFYEPETAIGWGKSDRTKATCDFAYQLTKRGFVTLSLGTAESSKAKTYAIYYPDIGHAQVEPLSMLACAAANAWYALAEIPAVDTAKIGIMGLSFGGKWAMFASCLFDKFACAVWSDPGIVFDETNKSVNYWEPWYLGYYPPPWTNTWRKKGVVPGAKGLYPKLLAEDYNLQELDALMAPRPFLVSGGDIDTPKRWIALNHTIAVNQLLGYQNRVAMTNDRAVHIPTSQSNDKAYSFFEYFLKYNGGTGKIPEP